MERHGCGLRLAQRRPFSPARWQRRPRTGSGPLNISAVIFDFYGTLARATTWGPAFEEVFESRGLSLSPEAHDLWRAEVFDGQEHLEHSQSREHYLTWELARLGRLAGVAGVRPEDTDALVAELHAASQAFQLEAYPEVPYVLTELDRRAVAVAVCSNWGWDLRSALDQAGLGGEFDVVVTSAQVGARKPHPTIFEATLELMEVEADECLFVGDTWYADVHGAAAAGMHPVHVARDDVLPDDAPLVPVEGAVQVPDLTGILALLPT